MTLNKLAALFLLIHYAFTAAGQNPTVEWGYGQQVFINQIKTNAIGEVYVFGTFEGTVDFDPGSTLDVKSSVENTQDVFVSKFTSTGQYLWSRQFGGAAFDSEECQSVGDDIAISFGIDQQGNLYLGGFYLNEIDFDPGSNVALIQGGGAIITKLNPNGMHIWSRQLAPWCPFFLALYDMAVDESGNVVCAFGIGAVNESVDVDPGIGSVLINDPANHILYLKLNSLGEYEWHKTIAADITNSDIFGLKVAFDADGSFYVSSGFIGPINVAEESNPVILNSFGERDVMLCKYTSAGSLVWARTISAVSSTANSIVSSIDVKNGRLVIGGHFSESFDFNPDLQANQLTALGTGNFDGFVACYEASSGQYVSAYKLGDIIGYDVVNDVTLDESGNVYAAGWGRGVIDFDPGPGVSTINFGVNMAQYVAKWNDDGAFFFAYGDNANNLSVEAMHVDSDNWLYMGGYYSGGEIDIDPSSSSFLIQGSNGWFAKYDQELTTDLGAVLNDRASGRLSVVVKPYQAIEVRLPENAEGGRVSVFDATGRLIDHQDIPREQPTARMNMHLASGGVYLVRWRARDGAVLSERFIYQQQP